MSAGDASDGLPALLVESAEDLYENAPCGYVSTDTAGSILRINGTLRRWLGYEHEPLVGRRLTELFTVGGRIYNETHVAPLLRMQGSVRSVAVDLLRADRTPLPVLMSSEVRVDPEGGPGVVRSTFFDASDRKAYERELLEARRRAEAADRAKSEFISMISHEIRTPLNALTGIAYLLAHTSLDEKQQKYVRTLRSSTQSLLTLVNEVLDLSKLESGRLSVEQRPVDLRRLAGDIVDTLRVTADEKRISLGLEVAPEVPSTVMGDPVKTTQVLTNLIGNAIKFTASGGVSTRIETTAGGGDGGRVRFTVTDTGIGIAPEQLGRIFDSFSQASYDIGMKYGGTGLGLAISRKLVELQGGQLAVSSEPGRGSTFWFELALAAAEDAEPAPSPKSEELLRGLHVLVVDDNEVNVYVLTGLLRDWGVDYEVAVNGREALSRVAAGAFAAVLMDLRMPELDGAAACHAIRALGDPARARTPIVAVSASTRIGQEAELANAGFDAFVGKPISPDVLYETLARLTGRSADGREG
jgi:PAS domain S-box-containing protein